MIKLSDVALLSLTKLHTRKIRTIITILLTSMLFGVLVMGSLVTNGVFRGVDSFKRNGLTGRYIVSVTKAFDSNAGATTSKDPALIAEAKKRYQQLVKAKTVEAKRLGIDYLQESDDPPYSRLDDNSEMLKPSDSNGIIHRLLKEKFSGQPVIDETTLRKRAGKYHSIGIYKELYYIPVTGSSLLPLKDGREAFYDISKDAVKNANDIRSPLGDGRLITAPDSLVSSFILPHNAGWQPDGRSLPIILSRDMVEYLLGLGKLPDNASTKERLDRLHLIYDKAKDLTFQMCYRNDVSQAQIQQAIRQRREINANKGKKDYQMPSLVYALPDATKCQNVITIRDTRTAEEKKQDANQKIFDVRFGKNTEPISAMVTFKIVGISPAVNDSVTDLSQPGKKERSRSFKDIVNDLLRVDSIGQVIPQSLYDRLPNKYAYAGIFSYTPTYTFGNEDNMLYFVEFATAKDAQKFIDEQSCRTQYDGTCKPSGRLYMADLVFSNSSAIDDIQKQARIWLHYAMLAVIVLAVAIMWITVGRTIVDGRHETAVFRAIGFKRIDIAGIYIVYTILLSLFITLCAFGLGIIGAHLLDGQLSPGLTAQAQYGFNELSSAKRISLVGYDWHQLGLIAIICLATGLLSAVFPLIRNVRRSPIRDMREE